MIHQYEDIIPFSEVRVIKGMKFRVAQLVGFHEVKLQEVTMGLPKEIIISRLEWDAANPRT